MTKRSLSSPLLHDFMAPLSRSPNLDFHLPFEQHFRALSHAGRTSRDTCSSSASSSRGSKPQHPVYDHDHDHDNSNNNTYNNYNININNSAIGDDDDDYDDFDDGDDDFLVDGLDEYHQGLLHAAASRGPRRFHPSFRRPVCQLQLGAACPAGPRAAPAPTPSSPGRRGSLARPPAARRPAKLVLAPSGLVPAKQLRRESFWSAHQGDELATPRLTLTRYDLRADEDAIYNWKRRGQYFDRWIHAD
ncbi:uncharacterized protein UV8b_07610 [Ustilaginoidea virens]|uniref:Uncharacterized protein n=1 Tax=Ustilaginoidea virens TaxID=1159556 RepID=A0A8E5HY79_USTVR|nr:uncharacterized protein UV8b_07610 [Ustilaginoidea virens]QUC23369.1 hypothetical protein UV8b_07610 [Ustilaginoidea virens]